MWNYPRFILSCSSLHHCESSEERNKIVPRYCENLTPPASPPPPLLDFPFSLEMLGFFFVGGSFFLNNFWGSFWLSLNQPAADFCGRLVGEGRWTMAIAEHSVVDLGRSFEKASQPQPDLADQDQAARLSRLDQPPLFNNHRALQVVSNGNQVMSNGHQNHHLLANGGGNPENNGEELEGDKLKRDIRELQELFSKLNPLAAEFVPPSLSSSKGINGQLYSSNGSILSHGGPNGLVDGGGAGRRVCSFLFYVPHFFLRKIIHVIYAVVYVHFLFYKP